MNATAAPSGRPAWAVTAWVDETHVYTEVESASGPVILKYDLTEGGLRDALNLLRNRHNRWGKPASPASNVKRVSPDTVQLTEAHLRLKKAGLL